MRSDDTPRSPRWVRACGCTGCVPGDGWRTCPCGCHSSDQRRLYEAKGRREALAELRAEK
jgi:hypothetical protein